MERHNAEHRLSGAILKLASGGLAMLAVIACSNSTATPGPTAPINLPAEAASPVTAAPNPTSSAGPTLLPEARSLPSGDPDLYRAIWAGTADEVRCRGVLSVVVKLPEMHIPPWYWFSTTT